mgnify:CR=1 FL=1
MLKNSRRILWGVIYGQMVQIIMFMVATKLEVNHVIIWATAAGLFVTVAVFAGMCVVIREYLETTNKATSKKEKEIKNNGNH